MELFSEIYSRYYELVARLLGAEPMDRRALERFVSERGFGESTLHLIPKLTGKDGWRLLEQDADGCYKSRLRHPPRRALSVLEKAWLKAVLLDPRAGLFLGPKEREALLSTLAGVEPLYDADAIKYFDRYLDGDNFTDRGYTARFRRILQALRSKSAMKIVYPARDSRTHVGHYVPLKLEFSQKDDKFRLHAARIRHGKLSEYATLNLARMLDAYLVDAPYEDDADPERFDRESRYEEPVIIEISKERNALERVMIEFSAYEKRSVYDADTETATCEIYYFRQDETEVLIKLLSFGPVIRVTGPERFLGMVRERVERQAAIRLVGKL